jgi:hypothetical protein
VYEKLYGEKLHQKLYGEKKKNPVPVKKKIPVFIRILFLFLSAFVFIRS